MSYPVSLVETELVGFVPNIPLQIVPRPANKPTLTLLCLISLRFPVQQVARNGPLVVLVEFQASHTLSRAQGGCLLRMRLQRTVTASRVKYSLS